MTTTMLDVSTYAPVLLPRDESIPATQFVRIAAQNRFSRASYRVLIIPALQEIRVRALHDEAYARQGTANIATRILRGETFGTAVDDWSRTRIDGHEALVAIITAYRDGFECDRLGCMKRGEIQIPDPTEELDGENCICTAAPTPLMEEHFVEVMWEHRESVWAVIVDGYASMTPKEARGLATALQEASQIAAVRNREAARASR